MTGFWIVVVIVFVAFEAQRWWRTVPMEAPKPSAWVPPPDAPLVSFLVPSWNGGTNVRAFIAAFRSLTYPHKELLLAVGGGDESLASARELETDDVIVLEQGTGEGKQASLRRCLERSAGAIVYLSDIDCRLSDEVVHALLAELVEGRAEAVTGPSRPLSAQLGDPFVRVQWAVERSTQPTILAATQGVLGRNAAVTRPALLAAGGFTVEAPSGTDYTLAKELLRFGTTITFVPSVPIPTEYPTEWNVYVRKQARWIRNVAVLAPRYRATVEQRAALMTIALPFGIGSLLVLGLIGAKAGLILALLSITHMVVSRYVALRATNIDAAVGAVVRHVVLDLAAAATAGRHLVTGAHPW